MKMRFPLVAALLVALLIPPSGARAAQGAAPSPRSGAVVSAQPPGNQAQIGFSIQDFLLCLQEGHGSGYPWTFTFQLCAGAGAPSDVRRDPARPVLRLED